MQPLDATGERYTAFPRNYVAAGGAHFCMQEHSLPERRTRNVQAQKEQVMLRQRATRIAVKRVGENPVIPLQVVRRT